MRELAFALAHLDALFGLSQVAYQRGYVRPVIHEGNAIEIVGEMAKTE